MRTTLFTLLLLTSLGAIAQPAPPPRHGPPPSQILPPGWWHDPYLSERVKLSADQIRRLDRLHDAQKADLERLEREIATADRDFRAALNDKAPKSEQILAAGNRLATIRDRSLRRQITLLAGQRAILTHTQWTALQQQLSERRRPAG